MNFKLFFDIALLALFAYFTASFTYNFVKEPGSIWQRFLAAGRDSAVIAWNRLVVIGVSAVNSAAWLSDALGQTGAADVIQSHLKPTYVAAFAVGVALLSIAARFRTLLQHD